MFVFECLQLYISIRLPFVRFVILRTYITSQINMYVNVVHKPTEKKEIR